MITIQNRQIKSASPTLQKPADDVGTAKADGKFETRHSRLGHAKLGRPDPYRVANKYVRLEQPFRR